MTTKKPAAEKKERTPAQIAAADKMRAAQQAKRAEAAAAKELGIDPRTTENPPMTRFVDALPGQTFTDGNEAQRAVDEADAEANLPDGQPEMFKTLDPWDTAAGVAHLAEQKTPKPGFRGNTAIGAPRQGVANDPMPQISPPRPIAIEDAPKAAQKVAAAEPPKPRPKAAMPRQVPSVIVKYREGLRVVHTFRGEGVWDVWYEASDYTEQVYNPDFKDATPMPGYFVQEELILDAFGDPEPFQGGVSGPSPNASLTWVATLEETEVRRGYR